MSEGTTDSSKRRSRRRRRRGNRGGSGGNDNRGNENRGNRDQGGGGNNNDDRGNRRRGRGRSQGGGGRKAGVNKFGGRDPVAPAERGSSGPLELTAFELFCNFHLGVTPDNRYRKASLKEIARRFGRSPDEIQKALRECGMDRNTLRNVKYDFSLAELDMRVAPEGVDKKELARVLFDEFMEVNPHFRQLKQEVEEEEEEEEEEDFEEEDFEEEEEEYDDDDDDDDDIEIEPEYDDYDDEEGVDEISDAS